MAKGASGRGGGGRNDSFAMADLQGTPKQVAWAGDLLQDMLTGHAVAVEMLQDNIKTSEKWAKIYAEMGDKEKAEDFLQEKAAAIEGIRAIRKSKREFVKETNTKIQDGSLTAHKIINSRAYDRREIRYKLYDRGRKFASAKYKKLSPKESEGNDALERLFDSDFNEALQARIKKRR